MLHLRPFLLVALLFGLAGSSFGQPPAQKGSSAKQEVDRGFDRVAPAIGQPLGDISAYDAEGKQIRLSSLKGHYTVLVFGCLT